MRTPPHEHARRAQSMHGNSAPGAGNPPGAFIVRRRRAIDAVRRARRAGRLVSQPKRADQRPGPTVLARDALRAMRRGSDEGT
jgi:hypothetical protein